MSEVRIGLIGAGLIGSTHAIMLRQIADVFGDRVRLVAVADPEAQSRAHFVDTYRFERAHADAAALLRDPDIDTVFICTPTRFHAELVDAAVDRGLDIFCEKPLAMTYAEAARMVERVETAGVRSQIGLVLRFSAVYSEMLSLIERPDAGVPMAVVFRDDQCFPIRGVHATAWRKDRALTAGGTLVEHGVHDVDLLTRFFGPIARLRAWAQNRAGHPGVEDYMAVEIEFASGLRAQLMNLWHNVIKRPSNRRLEIFCENAFVASDHDMAGSVYDQLGDGEEEKIPAEEVMRRFLVRSGRSEHPLASWFGISYMLQDLCFIEALLEGRPPAPDIRAGLEAQRLVEAIYHAAATGDEIDAASFVPASR